MLKQLIAKKVRVVIDILCEEDGATIEFRGDMDILNLCESSCSTYFPKKRILGQRKDKTFFST